MACLKHGDRVHTIDRIEELTIPYDHKITQAIESVLARLSAAAGLDHVDLQVYFVKSPSIRNAVVSPNGEVIVSNGFFAAIHNENELAAILAHEMAHVIARHAAEDCSGSALSYLLLGPFRPIVSAALLIEKLAFLVAIPQISCVSIARGLSRDRESEADYIGMLLMTEAGFHPRGAVTVIRKSKYLNEKSKQLNPQRNAQQPEFLSTHPHDATRIQQNSMWIPEVLEIVGRVPGYQNRLIPGIRRRDGGSTGGKNDALAKEKRRWKQFLDTRDRRKPRSLPRKDRSYKPLFEDPGWENLEEFSFRLV